ncbi:hypothetical protein [Deinococcus sp. QL22]|uniref:hypothetical protein n=1 Tax=Deinococcus sp. QL22 TaxID=2939437 RepID=UPI0020171A11|nr:hypothetical protein [Deinococcus sp. QL22]UQN04925.1 hypothetical protein M1R55_08315 [Deinococcus sp. QL22]
MSLSVVESSVRSRMGDPAFSADVLLVTPQIVAVLSGLDLSSGRQSVSLPHGLTPARFAATVGAAGLRALPERATLRGAVDALTAGLAGALARVQPGSLPLNVGFAFAAISNARREVWRVGPISVLHEDPSGAAALPPSLAAVAAGRALILHALLAGERERQASQQNGETVVAGELAHNLRMHDPSLPLLAPLLAAHAALANDCGPLGYGLINGRPVPDRLLHLQTLGVGKHEVVFATAGYPQPGPTLAVTERHLTELLRADPLLIERHPYIRAHRPDHEGYADRAYVRVRVR